MLKKIKHGTTIVVESMKKGNGPPYIDPNYEQATLHFRELCDKVREFLSNAEEILLLIPKVFKQASDFAGLTEKTYATFPEEDRTLSDRLSKLIADLQAFTTDTTASQSAERVIKPLRDLQTKLNELKKKFDQHHDSFLIMESNKRKLEDYQKKGEKKAKDAENYQEKVTNRTAEVEQLEKEFISEVSDLWENRFTLVGTPLGALMELVGQIGSTLNQSSAPLMELLGDEFMNKEYESQDPVDKKKK